MSLGPAIAAGFRNYSNFTGVASRSEFWWFQLFLVPVLGTITLIVLWAQPTKSSTSS